MLARHTQGLTLSELAGKVTLPTSTAHRLLTTLQNERYVRFANDRNLWFVGVQAFEVGSAFVRSRDIVGIARPFMRRLMEESGETVNIAVHDAGEVVFLDQVESRNMMRAIARPSYPSRTRAMLTIRGAAAPNPCNTRPASIMVKLPAIIDITHPAIKIT